LTFLRRTRRDAGRNVKSATLVLPGIGLEAALEKARILYEHEGRHAAPFEAIVAHWGYTAKSGAGQVALAALRKFGLLIYEGKSARLSDLAFQILWDEEDSEARRTAIKQAALNPTIHRELWDQYGASLPSDTTLKLELRRRGFAESAIPEFLDQFRSTLAFAQLTEADRVPDRDGDTAISVGESPGQMTSLALQPPSTRKPGPGAPAAHLRGCQHRNARGCSQRRP
jgi:hypothetical protein